jgi:hypothetical protein
MGKEEKGEKEWSEEGEEVGGERERRGSLSEAMAARGKEGGGRG